MSLYLTNVGISLDVFSMKTMSGPNNEYNKFTFSGKQLQNFETQFRYHLSIVKKNFGEFGNFVEKKQIQQNSSSTELLLM